MSVESVIERQPGGYQMLSGFLLDIVIATDCQVEVKMSNIKI